MDELTSYLIETGQVRPCDSCGELNNVADLEQTDEGFICRGCEEVKL